MTGGMILALPKDLAEELIEEGTSVRSFTTRGSSIGDVAQLVLNVVTAGSNLVTVATAAAAVPAFVRRLRSYLRRKRGEGELNASTDSIAIRANDKEVVITLSDSLSDEEAQQVLMAAILNVQGQ